MTVTVKRRGSAFEVLEGGDSLPDGQEVRLFTEAELSAVMRQRRDEVDLQMPSFLRGDEDENAEELFDR